MKLTILSDLLPELEARIQKFQKKYNKYGTDTFSYSKGEPYVVEDTAAENYMKEVVDVEISGAYKVQGYQIVASCEWLDNQKANLIYSDENISIPARFRTSCNCEHCNTNRQRKHTTILRNEETGEFKQVGNSCLADYFGQSIVTYAGFLSDFNSLEEWAEQANHSHVAYSPTMFRVENIVLRTAEYVVRHGYVSREDCFNNAVGEFVDFEQMTASKIADMFYERMSGNKLLVPYYQDSEISAEAEELAKKAVAYALEEGAKEDASEYNKNLVLLLTSEYSNKISQIVSTFGIYRAYQRRLQREKDREALNAVLTKSQYVGNVGDRVEIKAVPTLVSQGESDYGNWYLYRFIFNDNVYTWFTSSLYNTEKEVTIRGTIKAHEEYNGCKQNVLTRCRVA